MNVLISPLDWGLGHATRLVPVVRHLLGCGHRVVLAGSGKSLQLLRADFPQLEAVDLPSFSPVFSGGNSQVAAIARQVPVFLRSIWAEHRATQRLVEALDIDMVISDNRYGVRSRRCRSVIITHQLSPRISRWCPAPVEWLLSVVLCRLVSQFDECLVPDVAVWPAACLSGELSRPRGMGVPVKAVGFLSRLSGVEPQATGGAVDWLAIVSGPEPQRTIFEGILIKYMSAKSGRRVIVRGLPEGSANDLPKAEGIEFHNHCTPEVLAGLIGAAANIICRSGYSTLMDLQCLGKTALLVPTPGQAEQEYLARHMAEFGFNFINQKAFEKNIRNIY